MLVFLRERLFAMKIIVAETAGWNNKNGLAPLNILDALPSMWLKADSALLKGNKPVFVPDFTEELSAVPYLALRVSRMGKSIPVRFARRYYDGVGLAVDFTAEDVLRRLRSEGAPWDTAKSWDGSLQLSEFEDMPASGSARLSLEVNGTECNAWAVNDVECLAARVIEAVSRVFTIRQGDLLLVGQAGERPLVEIDDHVVGRLNGKVMTEFNVK